MPYHTNSSLIPFVVWLLLTVLISAENVPVDPSRPFYQKKEGFPSTVITYPIPGGLNECRLPDPVTIAELKKQLEMQKLRHAQDKADRLEDHKTKQHAAGSLAIVIGWALVAFGAAAHFATSTPLVKSCSSSIITLGVFAIIGGMGLQMTVEYEFWLKAGLFISLIAWIAYRLYKYRDVHILDKFTRNKRKPESGTQIQTKEG